MYISQSRTWRSFVLSSSSGRGDVPLAYPDCTKWSALPSFSWWLLLQYTRGTVMTFQRHSFRDESWLHPIPSISVPLSRGSEPPGPWNRATKWNSAITNLDKPTCAFPHCDLPQIYFGETGLIPKEKYCEPILLVGHSVEIEEARYSL